MGKCETISSLSWALGRTTLLWMLARLLKGMSASTTHAIACSNSAKFSSMAPQRKSSWAALYLFYVWRRSSDQLTSNNAYSRRLRSQMDPRIVILSNLQTSKIEPLVTKHPQCYAALRCECRAVVHVVVDEEHRLLWDSKPLTKLCADTTPVRNCTNNQQICMQPCLAHGVEGVKSMDSCGTSNAAPIQCTVCQ